MQSHIKEVQTPSTASKARNDPKQQSTFHFDDNRPEAIQMRKLQKLANNSAENGPFQFVDNRPEVAQRKTLQTLGNNSPYNQQLSQFQRVANEHTANQGLPLEKDPNHTGLPDNLKTEKAIRLKSSHQFVKKPLQFHSSSKGEVLQPVWINYRLGNILMWDQKLEGIRWYYAVRDHKLYYIIEGPRDLARSLGIQKEESDSYPLALEKMEALRNNSGMENARVREAWMTTGLFGHEKFEPAPAPVVPIEDASRNMTAKLQPQADLSQLGGLESPISSASLLSAEITKTPLFKIIHLAAEELRVSVWELEMRLGSPSVYYNAYKADKENSGQATGLYFADAKVGQMENFTEYIKYLVKGKKLTGSCGQTSSWINRISGGLMGKDGGQETALPVRDFLNVLDAYKNRPFYMRVLSGGHSFIIESSGQSMAIYQSWHGSSPMAFMLESELRSFPPNLMVEKLATVLEPKKSMIGMDHKRTATSKELFYGQDHKDPTPLVWFHLNLKPLTPKEIHDNIVRTFNKYYAQWEYALSDGEMESMDIAPKDDELGPESSPKDMGQLLGDYNVHTDAHKGLTYLHQHQEELVEDSQALDSKPDVMPSAHIVYEFANVQKTEIPKLFEINPNDVDKVINFDDPEHPVVDQIQRAVFMGKLKEGAYKHIKSGIVYKVTKNGEGLGSTYTFKKQA